MLYECLTGTKPFTGNSPYAVMHAIVSATVAPPSTLVAGLPEALDGIVLRAMRRDPATRFPSVAALAAALLPWASPALRARYAAEFDVVSPAEPAPSWRFTARKFIWMPLAIVGALALALALGARQLPARASMPSLTPVPVAPANTPPPAASTAPPPPASTSAPAAPTANASRRAPKRPAEPTVRSTPERGSNGALILE
jgi:serine/threonine-protein kinase